MQVVDFIDDYNNDEDEGIIESPPYKKRIGGIGKAEKGVDFNKALEKNMMDIN